MLYYIEERLKPLCVESLSEAAEIIAMGCPIDFSRPRIGQIARIIRIGGIRIVGKITHETYGLEVVSSETKVLRDRAFEKLCLLIFKLHYKGYPFVSRSRIFFDTRLILWNEYSGHGRLREC